MDNNFKTQSLEPKKESINEPDDNSEDCPVCYEKLGDEQPLICKHYIHISCIQKQFKPECPLCRHPLDIKVYGEKPENYVYNIYDMSEEMIEHDNANFGMSEFVYSMPFNANIEPAGTFVHNITNPDGSITIHNSRAYITRIGETTAYIPVRRNPVMEDEVREEYFSEGGEEEGEIRQYIEEDDREYENVHQQHNDELQDFYSSMRCFHENCENGNDIEKEDTDEENPHGDDFGYDDY
jgi:hypothetical protein